MEHHLTPTECHLPYRITVLPATRHKWTHPAFTPARQADTRFTYPGGMEGRVDLGDLLHTEMVYRPADGHPSTNRAQCRLTTLIELNALTTTLSLRRHIIVTINTTHKRDVRQYSFQNLSPASPNSCVTVGSSTPKKTEPIAAVQK